MRVKLGQEMWVLDGELLIPWVRLQSGEGARGIAMPKPLVLEKGQEVEVYEAQVYEIRFNANRVQTALDTATILPCFHGQDSVHDIQERVDIRVDGSIPSREGLSIPDRRTTSDDGPAHVSPLDRMVEYLTTNIWKEQKVEPDELLAEMGHAKDECACWCKGCNSGKHCHDQRCYPLYD